MMTNKLNLCFFLLVPFLPFLSGLISALCCINLFKKIPASRTILSVFSVLSILISCICSMISLFMVKNENYFNFTVYTWMKLNNLDLKIGFLIDPLSAIMMVIITSISLIVHFYTIEYMKKDKGYARFFSYISLFTFSMLMLVMSNNFLQLFFGWETVGLISYLLIGFWYKKPSAVFANTKAFLINRLGDMGLILGIGLLLSYTNSLDYYDIFSKKEFLAKQDIFIFDWNLLTIVCTCFFIGAMGKSAQFPLHIWLPDSMEGPTPISALIHAATMVTAGIFLVVRMSPLFEETDQCLSLVLITGSITALLMGLLGIVQNDIKRIIAYSTISQLGYMTIALGVSAYPIAIFHLTTHAFFKALLFLSAGSVIIGMNHNQDIRTMGGLWKYMPYTCFSMLIGCLSLSGVPFFSGFYSKDLIIEAVKNSNIFGAKFAYFVLLSGIFITAFYSFRMYFLVFHGKENFCNSQSLCNKSKESSYIILIPLIILVIPSIFLGYFFIDQILLLNFFKNAIYINNQIHPAFFNLIIHFQDACKMAVHALHTSLFYLTIGGIFGAYIFCSYQRLIKKIISYSKFFKILRFFLQKKYFIDDLFYFIFWKNLILFGQLMYKYVENILINKMIIGGIIKFILFSSKKISALQSGYLYHYVLVMILGVFSFINVMLFL